MKAYTERVFGNVEGQDVLAYRFETDGGYQLEVMTYGRPSCAMSHLTRMEILPMLFWALMTLIAM